LPSQSQLYTLFSFTEPAEPLRRYLGCNEGDEQGFAEQGGPMADSGGGCPDQSVGGFDTQMDLGDGEGAVAIVLACATLPDYLPGVLSIMTKNTLLPIIKIGTSGGSHR
jgi:hypothetical protein